MRRRIRAAAPAPARNRRWLRRACIARERPRYQLLGPTMLATLIGDDTQKMQSVDVLRIDRQHFAVSRLGLRQAPHAMVLQGDVDWPRAGDSNVFGACPLQGLKRGRLWSRLCTGLK